ncbi:hypothetical protein DAPPUDRAFT_335571 [Daphnia pulex]|uniref:Uncharacterized protein n=1 Tax=Daphnia pulex TaxID=6669 RepID=E9HY17_DAPPU|nr:hypothetical protein DAPPUDRAFT_335571 [Daphnia pulex]|eukprot:EFX63362.1 hypothetical protein DAPPUDRAFT_335571 [Daphnia pulex]
MECGTSEVSYDPLAMKSFGNREIASRWAGISEYRTVWSIWRSLLEKTDKLAAVEIFQTQIADGGMYEKVAEYFSIMSRLELYTCSASQFSFGKIKEQAQTISRDYDLACFVDAFPILNQHITYDFEPCDNDVITTVDQAHGAGPGLIQSGKQYECRVAQESKKIRESTRTLQTLQGMKESGLKSDPNEPNGPDIDAKIYEIKNQLRRSDTAKIKAEARLECLHAGGVKVDEFLQDAEGLVTLGLMRSSSQLSFRESAHEESEFSDRGSRAGPETLSRMRKMKKPLTKLSV